MLIRIALAAAAMLAARPARADDDCRGDDAWDERCSALWPTRDGRKPASFAIGWAAEAIDPSGDRFEVKRKGTRAPIIGYVSGDDYALMRGNGFYIDVRVHPTRDLYAGVSLRAAYVDSLAPKVAFAGAPPWTWDSAGLFTMAGLVGARVPLGPIAVRGELVAGIHGADLYSSQFVADGSVRPLVEPRVALDLRLSPYWTLEAYGGENVLARSERVFGLGLGVHLQAFDGRY